MICPYCHNSGSITATAEPGTQVNVTYGCTCLTVSRSGHAINLVRLATMACQAWEKRMTARHELRKAVEEFKRERACELN